MAGFPKNRISRERQEQALRESLSFGDFIESAQANRETLRENYAAYELNEQDLDFFAELEKPVVVLALAHDWCGDVAANLPLFARLEQATGKLNLRIIPRDPGNRDIADLYPYKDGQSRIPTYLFFSEAGEELGYFIERPDDITVLLKVWQEQFWTTHPELEGRGKPFGELAEDVRGALLADLKTRRQEVRNLEKSAILGHIRGILSPQAERAV
ncbi:thioredoxin family protein [Paenibacillus rhizovicinus]|uniref:Thioredoxin family protein n=1 Tax=Paenibacillus rhizovicinus TaxID=2704463 RepID=A0A6C0NXG0_9BACL|nr:thioredoxin family protein [Paenibacillus rhizovicinus]QHW30889.1 thioredoxin family protein [Paenibacillus rhizovicinus]